VHFGRCGQSEIFGLRGKPAPDIFLETAHRLGVAPAQAVVFEDAVAGIAAARAGGFGLIIGSGAEGTQPRSPRVTPTMSWPTSARYPWRVTFRWLNVDRHLTCSAVLSSNKFRMGQRLCV
jgi:FMN phosphatase YigB (HAD superfamily)